MNDKRTTLLREAPIPKALMSLGIPAIIAMLIGAVYNIVDTLFIGLLGDTAALGAAAVLFPVNMLIGAVGLTFGMGAAAVISVKLGQRKRDEASTVASTAFFTTVAVALASVLLGLANIKPLLTLFGATPSIMEQSLVYGSIIIGGAGFQMINMCMNNMLRAEGAARISGVAISLGAILNILLDPLFMFVFDMGLAGAAAATVTGQGISTLLLLSFYLRKTGIIRLKVRYISPRLNIYRQIMTIGIPTFLRQCLTSMAMALMTNAAAPFEDSAIAAIGITLRIYSFPMMVLFGFGQGFQPLAGFAYGAGDLPRVRGALRYALGWTTIFSSSVTLLLMVTAPALISAFSRDPDVIRMGIRALRTMTLALPLLGFQNTYAVLFQALAGGGPPSSWRWPGKDSSFSP